MSQCHTFLDEGWDSWGYNESRWCSQCPLRQPKFRAESISVFPSQWFIFFMFFFFQAEDGIRDKLVTGVQTCALPISFQVALERLAIWRASRPPASSIAWATLTTRLARPSRINPPGMSPVSTRPRNPMAANRIELTGNARSRIMAGPRRETPGSHPEPVVESTGRARAGRRG